MKLIIKLSLIILFAFYFIVLCSAGKNIEVTIGTEKSTKFAEHIMEQGRTFAHNLAKRFMVLVPVIFFKIGIAFTLLVLVTMVAINNGFIGFLLLVVGLSSVLARFQDRRNPPAVSPVPLQYVSPYYRHANILQALDRNDGDIKKDTIDISQHSQPLYQYYIKPHSDYYGQKLQ